jgi:hypothetical protein
MPSSHVPKDSSGKPIWFDEFIEYSANPLDKRTYNQFAESVGVTDTTLWRYRNLYRDEISKEVEVRRKRFLTDLRSKAYKSLADKLSRDTNALKLFFQLSGDLVERTENTNINMMTREEKEKKLAELLAKLSNQFENGQKPNSSESK